MSVPDLVAEAREALLRSPPWLTSLLLLGLFVAVGLLAHFFAVRLIARAIRGRDGFWLPFLLRTRSPTRLGMVLLSVGLAAPLSPLTAGEVTVLRHLLAI